MSALKETLPVTQPVNQPPHLRLVETSDYEELQANREFAADLMLHPLAYEFSPHCDVGIVLPMPAFEAVEAVAGLYATTKFEPSGTVATSHVIRHYFHPEFATNIDTGTRQLCDVALPSPRANTDETVRQSIVERVYKESTRPSFLFEHGERQPVNRLLGGLLIAHTDTGLVAGAFEARTFLHETKASLVHIQAESLHDKYDYYRRPNPEKIVMARYIDKHSDAMRQRQFVRSLALETIIMGLRSMQ